MERTYVWHGDDERDFPSLGATLKPGQQITTEKKHNHPDLRERKHTAPKPVKREAPAAAPEMPEPVAPKGEE